MGSHTVLAPLDAKTNLAVRQNWITHGKILDGRKVKQRGRRNDGGKRRTNHKIYGVRVLRLSDFVRSIHNKTSKGDLSRVKWISIVSSIFLIEGRWSTLPATVDSIQICLSKGIWWTSRVLIVSPNNTLDWGFAIRTRVLQAQLQGLWKRVVFYSNPCGFSERYQLTKRGSRKCLNKGFVIHTWVLAL